MNIFRKTIKRILNKYRYYLFTRRNYYLTCSYSNIVNNKVINYGHGNQIIVDNGSELNNCEIYFGGNNCILHIGSHIYLSENNFWFEDEGSEIIIGDSTSTESGCQFAACEGKKIIIGKDCMFSHDIDVRNTDSHSILNEKGERTNPAEDIIIGNHVWVGIRSTLLKGSIIPPDCVVAAQSMITSSLKAFDHSLIAGSPANVLKTNISWDRKRI